MPLFSCPICQNKCSTQASECPKCGHPFTRNKNAQTLEGFSSNNKNSKKPFINWKLLTIVVGFSTICLVSFAIYQLKDTTNFIKVFGYSKEQKEYTKNAIKALEKIDAATEVGLNKIKYSDLLIDAKAAVNQANSILPKGKLRDELNAAVESYTDAGFFWDGKVISQSGENIGTKYLNTIISESQLDYSSFESIQKTRDELKTSGLTLIWAQARTHLTNAIRLNA